MRCIVVVGEEVQQTNKTASLTGYGGERRPEDALVTWAYERWPLSELVSDSRCCHSSSSSNTRFPVSAPSSSTSTPFVLGTNSKSPGPALRLLVCSSSSRRTSRRAGGTCSWLISSFPKSPPVAPPSSLSGFGWVATAFNWALPSESSRSIGARTVDNMLPTQVPVACQSAFI